MKKSSTKSETNTKTSRAKTGESAKAKTKEPLISTGKKIGLTIYFTFVFTLMAVMGLQLWMHSLTRGIDNN